MAAAPLWQQLIQLAELDKKQATVQSQVAKIEKEIAQDQQMLPELERTIAELKQAVHDAKKHVDHQELNAKTLKEQEENKRKALDEVTNEKMYAALEKEIASISQELLEQDDLLMKAWHALDQAKQKLAGSAELEAKMVTLKNDAAEKAKGIAALQEQIDAVEQEKAAFIGGGTSGGGNTSGGDSGTIPEEWLAKYNRMKTRVADPVVPVINTSCSSCFYSVPPQDMNRLKNQALLPCRSCYRYLYYNREVEEETKEASF